MAQKTIQNGCWLFNILLISLYMIPVCNAAKPAFKCKKLKSSIEEMVCKDAKLGELDQKLQATYNKALKKIPRRELKPKKPFSAVGVKGRNDC